VKKYLLLLSLVMASTPCFALFNTQLPQQIVCDERNFCKADDNKYEVSGWSLGSSSGYLKPGIYKFDKAWLMGNPNDNLEKQVLFDYVMIDKDGYNYMASYSASNWLVPINKEKYIRNGEQSVCQTDNISYCYVTLLAPQLPKN
jgi:hypothetical protein